MADLVRDVSQVEPRIRYEAADVAALASVSDPMNALCSDLRRPVYCVFGIPIDAVDMAFVVQRIVHACANKTELFISTPNLDFLVQCRDDPDFRETLLDSDLCPVDGAPIIWIGKLAGVPLNGRVSGSDMLEKLRTTPFRPPLSLCIFGGGEGVAEKARQRLDETAPGLRCVGAINPGFGNIEELSTAAQIDRVNATNADFLVAALGAKKGQLWLYRNRKVLKPPVRAHLGAAVNFVAGTIKRAPILVRKLGLEWLWRIKEEPYLWRRYAYDAQVLLWLAFTRVLPAALVLRWDRWQRPERDGLFIRQVDDRATTTIVLRGHAVEPYVDRAITCFEAALSRPDANILIDLSGVLTIDARFVGVLMMLRKCLKARGNDMACVAASAAARRRFRLLGAEYLLHRPRA